ncbi:MAG: hypothetical protein MUE33_10445 [Cytophagaceae bacterium]|nr:hypothetical protein [Cytophagaceae bacterium]
MKSRFLYSIVFILSIVFSSSAVVQHPPEKKGKHKSHKKAKKSKSKYLFNFQH